MATGDQNDFISRLRQEIPVWFGDWVLAPIVNLVIVGMATPLVTLFSQQTYIRLQTRIKTATDGFLDLIAFDFFGTRISRPLNQADAPFRTTIIRELFRPRATRQAVIQILTDVTGRVPIIIEPEHPGDTGAYGVPTSGYGVAGYYGSMVSPYQTFIIAFRPTNQGAPGSPGYGNPQLAYGVVGSSSQYADHTNVFSNANDAAIFAAIDSVKPEATTLWTTIKS